ncbi:hypothetical protein ACJMK2_042514 [Sinanodonta woodiana]|uniref:SOCS box domain-containing protein n=1 Tax=Sinanodonta woodiana TaxID=1069815 RepID=A0ABD3WAX9_SINWO
MGLYNSHIYYKTIQDADGIKKCVPRTRYRKFPPHLQKAPGSLIKEFQALPQGAYHVVIPDEAYWWIDAQFLPHNDCTLFTSSGAYILRGATRAWVPVPHFPIGRICRFDLDKDRLKCEVFKQTGSSSLPKVQPHPDGQYIGYLGNGEVRIDTIDYVNVYKRAKDLNNANFRFCAFSPDGRYMAVVCRSSMSFELHISNTQLGFNSLEHVVSLRKMCKDFKGTVAYNEMVECKWTTDSKYILVSSSMGHILVISCPELELVCSVFDDIIPGNALSQVGAFDCNPRSCHEVLAFGSDDYKVFLVNITSKKVLYESRSFGVDPIDCVQFTPLGHSVAIALRSYKILLFDAHEGNTLFQIEMKDICSSIKTPPPGYPGVLRLSFSSTGQEMAVSTCDGVVRIWQLPMEINLQNLCKLALLSLVPAIKLQALPLPQRLISQLLSIPIML